MKIAIVHLSDIHFKSSSDIGFRRREKLANTIAFSRSPEERLLLVVTGDVANTGSPDEYRVAEDFFRQLLIDLRMNAVVTPSELTLIPGNHDCNFHELGDLRPRLLAEVAAQLDTIDDKGETVKTLLQVQKDFFSFQQRITGESIPPESQLFFVKKFDVDGRTLELRCFNSAWLSSKHEETGSLGFPLSTVEAATAKTDSDIVISIVHHPSNWLSPSAYQGFRRAVQENSDFLFTGHEHTLGGQVIASFGGSNLIHFESGPYQPADSGDSEFGILHIDLDNRTWKHEDFKWTEGSYAKFRDGISQSLFDKTARCATLQVTSAFLNRLSDPGTGFLHPRLQQNLTLPDIYIYPDLRTRSIRKLSRSEDLPKFILNKEVPERLLNAKRVVIAGPGDSGKTALSKMLFLEGNTKYGRSCLLLCGKSVKGANPEDAFIRSMDEAIQEQYGADAHGRFAGLNAKDRVLLIDDWDEVCFSRAGRLAILNRATEHFACVILLVDDIFLVEELSGRHEHVPLAKFEIADIREFGFRLRGQMIRKWHTLGNAFVEDEESLARRIADSTRVIDTVLNRNLLPPYPVNILTLLQTYDAGAGSHNGGLGSYGQVYEALITARLVKVSVKSIDIGTKITFLARFAWRLFSTRQRCLNESEWADLGAQYYKEYKTRVDAEQLRSSCIAAAIITEDVCGYKFTYGYAYCYFVAKYFQENLADLDDPKAREDLFSQLKGLSERVYNQNNANIVIFYVFLTRDRSLINHVLANAKNIFADMAEFDFDSHLQFLNRVIQPLRPLHLPEGRPDVNQQAYDQQRDERGEQIEPSGDPAIGDVLYSPELPFEQKLIIGIRYLTLMGQILRNFPGSLKADTKLELAFESYSLGLRILSAVFALAQRDSEAMVKDIAELLRNKMAFSGTERELLTRAELILAELLREITFSLLKRVSHAIGLRELEATYDEVADLRDNSLSSRLIHLSIRLDHFERFPKDEIEKLAEELDRNVFSYQALRDLVLNHLYLFPRDYGIQQWAGSVLNMKVDLPEVRGSARKLRTT